MIPAVPRHRVAAARRRHCHLPRRAAGGRWWAFGRLGVEGFGFRVVSLRVQSLEDGIRTMRAQGPFVNCLGSEFKLGVLIWV